MGAAAASSASFRSAAASRTVNLSDFDKSSRTRTNTASAPEQTRLSLYARIFSARGAEPASRCCSNVVPVTSRTLLRPGVILRGMRRVALPARLVLATALAATVGSGCGSSGEAGPAPNPSDTVNPRAYLLQPAELARLARPYRPAGAVTTVLEFWRAVQYQNYAVAYLRLSADLRRAVPYRRFLPAIAEARGRLFLVKPAIDDVQRNGPLTTVYLRLQRGKRFSSTDQIIGFNVAQKKRRWTIATDPYNLFRVAPS